MEFEFPQDQSELISRIRDFAMRELRKAATGPDQESTFARDKWKLCGEQGLLGLPLPPEYGGSGQGCLATTRIMENLGELSADRGLLFSVAAHTFACAVPLWRNASEVQRQEWLPRLCSGEWIGANAATESEAGSDIFALRTTASRKGTEYILTGKKSFVANGPVADIFVVYASTDRSLGALGISAFGVPRSSAGLQVGPPFGTIGLNTTPMSGIVLDGCRVSESFRLGEEGEGKKIFELSMTWERLGLFGIWVGLMQAQLERALVYAKERRQFGRPIGKNQAISHRIADMKLRLESARLLLYRACWLLDSGSVAAIDCSLAKLAVSEAAVRSSLDLLQIHGAAGMMTDSGLEQQLRDVIPSTIYSGTSEMHREIIAASLGL